MAYLYRRKDGRIEIREARTTARGPRSHTLASFNGPLREAHLDRAAANARRPFDRQRLRARAAALGIPVARRDANSAARALAAALREGGRLDPVLAQVLHERLGRHERAELPEHLADVEEWIGAGEAMRGRALRDLLRLYGRIVESPDAPPPPARVRHPRLELRDERASA